YARRARHEKKLAGGRTCPAIRRKRLRHSLSLGCSPRANPGITTNGVVCNYVSKWRDIKKWRLKTTFSMQTLKSVGSMIFPAAMPFDIAAVHSHIYKRDSS